MATYEWESVTLGQNPEIQKIVSAAVKASELLNTNVGLAKSGLKLAQVFLRGVLNPKIEILNAIADEIDNFVNDFKGTGFYVLEVTPTGKELIPKDADGNPIKLLLSAPAIVANAAAAAAVGQTAEFVLFAQDKLGIADYETEGAKNASYAVVQGKAEPFVARKDNANDDAVATKDPLFGMYKFTPSQVIAQTIAAMDDKYDERRPQFSSSAEVGAIMVIVGYSDLSTNLPSIKSAIEALVSFFGGETGLFTKGFQKVGNLIAAALNQLENVEENNVTLVIDQVSGVLGTDEDGGIIESSDGLENFPDQFEENDFVIGPRAKFGARALGYISKVIETTTPNTNEIYQKQELIVTGATKDDATAFRNLGAGAVLQLAHYEKAERRIVDNNSGKSIIGGYYNSYKYFEDLSARVERGSGLAETHQAATKVERKSKDPFLSILKYEDLEDYTTGKMLRKSLVGKIAGLKEGKAPPPNFKAAKLEDLMGDFQKFFSSINTLSDTLRNIAGDSSTELDKFIKYLDGKIKELDDINKSLQSILKLFTDGLPKGGVYVLTIEPAIGGNDLIKSALSGASNKPPDDLDFAIGFLMMGGGPSMKVLTSLLASAK